jgi:molybdopterin converting factor small subunit
LQERFNGVYDRLCQPDGTVRGSVLVLVNDEDVRFLRELQTPVRSGDSVRLIPAFAGG